jgi:hypothetical protein
MKTVLICMLSLLLCNCATVPRQFEDERIILIDGVAWVKDADTMTAAEVQAIASEYTVPVLDDAERRACKRVLWGQGADLATTAIGLSLGCSEANPLYGGNVAAIVAVKAWLMLGCQAQAERTPAAFSTAKAHNFSAGVGVAAAAWNLTRLPGC